MNGERKVLIGVGVLALSLYASASREITSQNIEGIPTPPKPTTIPTMTKDVIEGPINQITPPIKGIPTPKGTATQNPGK